MTFKWKASDFEELVSKEILFELKEWNKSQEEIPLLTDEQLVCFSLSCDCDIEATKYTINEHFKVKFGHKCLFTERSFKYNDMQIAWDTNYAQVFPKRTPDGSVIIFLKLRDTNPKNYCFNTTMKLVFMTIDLALFESPPKDAIILIDTLGTSLRHLTKIDMQTLKAFVNYFQEGLPIKLKALHIINVPKIFNMAFNMTKPLMKEKILKKQHFYEKNLDFEFFHQTAIAKEYLPADYGGTLPSLEDLRNSTKKRLEEMINAFDTKETQNNK